MSEFAVRVVNLDSFGKHPDADTLSIISIEGNPVVFRTEEFQPGDQAAYIPVDAAIKESSPIGQKLSFLKFKKGVHRVKAVKLRGVFSMGVLVPMRSIEEIQPIVAEMGVTTGACIAKILDIEKAEDPIPLTMSGDCITDPGLMPVYDVESWRKYKACFEPNEEVVVTEKIHGCNTRFIHDGTKLWVGSHRTWKALNEHSPWWRIAKDLNIEERLLAYPHLGLFGEIYGAIQDLHYGKENGLDFAVFDVWDAQNKKFLGWDEVENLCGKLGLPTVPVLYRGLHNVAIIEPLAEGVTTIGGGNIREGVVIKTTQERWNPKLGRMIAKLVSEGYLLRKNGTELH
jgi:RNA ligase (TIGR02306 family)